MTMNPRSDNALQPMPPRFPWWRQARRLALCLAMASSFAVPTSSFAAGERAEGPGWYRTMIGRFTVTALWDGTLEMPVDQVFARPAPATLKALLAQAGMPAAMTLPVNAFVIDTGSRIVMVDTGTGTSRSFGDKLGRLQANLNAAGYTPEQIDEIYVTHMHTDHVGGLSIDGRAVFPKAIVRAEAREAGHYLSRETMAAHPDDKEDFESAMASLEPYVKSGRFSPFEGRTELVPGVQARPAVGHTPGHTAYVVESDGQRLILWGDLMHVAPVQFPRPDATVRFDFSQKDSAARRAEIFREAARDGSWVAAAHVGFPGIGKLRAAKGGGYVWTPISLINGR